MPLAMTRIICFDTETTGFEYARGERIIEVAAVEIVDGKITGRNFHEYINPDGRVIPRESYMVHKLSNEFLADARKFADVAPALLEFFGDSEIVAHNGIGFDFPFLNYELAQIGLPQIPRERQNDTMLMATRKLFGPKSYTLDSLAKWFGISTAARADAHGALIDAEILAHLYLELVRADDARTVADKISDDAAALTVALPELHAAGANFPRRAARSPNATESAAHDEFISKIKDPMWKV